MPDFNNSCFEGISRSHFRKFRRHICICTWAKYLEKHFTLQHSHQFVMEQAHLGSMTVKDLTLIKNISKEFEIIRNHFNG